MQRFAGICSWRTALSLLALAGPLNAAIEWEHSALTIDAEPFDEEAVGVFAFTNTGDRPIEILDVHSSCGCTVPELDKKIYAPGDRGELRALFTFNGREGLQVKTITVSTDDAESPHHELTLAVNIPRLFKAEPRFVVWSQGQAPEPKTISIRVLAPDVLKLTEVECRDERFATELAVEEGTPGLYSLVVTPQNTDEKTQATITVKTNVPTETPRVITIYALIR